jgi:UDP-N-acetylmuramoyl-tripeptide--D-alanyl-D-alanine ligase
MVPAALAAAAVGRILGLSGEETVSGISRFSSVAGRANARSTGYITINDDCYNANPNSVTAAFSPSPHLKGVRSPSSAICSELGRDSDGLHRDIGLLAGRCGIKLPHLLRQKSGILLQGLISGGQMIEAWHFLSRMRFFSVLPSLIKKGDNVLVKASHGMHFEEVVKELEKLK